MIRNTLDGKVYVGQAADIALRKSQHLRALRRGDHRNIRMQRAFVRDGETAFEFSTIEECSTEQLTEREQFWIDAHSYIYNICPAGGSSLGVKRSAETRAKISAAKIGKTPAPMSIEARARSVATRTARWAATPKAKESAEAGKRRGESLRARWAVNPKKPPSAEGRLRMSESAKKRWKENPLSVEAIARATASRARNFNG